MGRQRRLWQNVAVIFGSITAHLASTEN